MSFTYTMGSNPQIDYPRMLIGDTVDQGHIFEDEEIVSAFAIQGMQYQSSMLYSGVSGAAALPVSSVSYFRVAAMLLDALASNKARLAVTRLLDAEVDFGAASRALHEQAKAWRQLDEDSGAFVLVEQVTTGFSFIDRFYKQVQRASI